MGRLANDWQCTPFNCGSGSWPLQYSYNLDGTLAAYTNGRSVTLSYTYNSGQRPISVGSSWTDGRHPSVLFSSPHYNAYGQMTSDVLANGVTETAGFDARGRLQYANAATSSATIYSLNTPSTPISYAPNGNITAANDSANGSWGFAYDLLDRISSASKAGSSFTYSDPIYASDIDRNGNRQIQYVNGSGSPNLLFNQSTNQISSSSGVTYDAAGNVQTWNDGSMTHTYTYDAEGRMVSIDSGSVQYAYDAFGRRAEKNVSGHKYDYAYDLAGNMVMEYDVYNGWWERGEISVAGRHLATYANDTTYFDHQDWLGNERVRSDLSGNVYETWTDTPYGDGLACTGSCAYDVSLIHFAGMELDQETGFYHTQFRYYNPRLGSWMTPDPAGMGAATLSNPQSLNRYAYALNNPISYRDPLGLECVWDDGSFDAEDDAGTGSAGNCAKAGGTWIELGQGGGWSPDPASYNNGLPLSGLVGQIQAGNVGSITSLGADGMVYQTGYNGAGQVTYTNTPDSGLTVYGNTAAVPNSSSATDWVELGGCCTTSTRGALSPSGQAAAVAISSSMPTMCGGGGFAYAGVAGEKGGGEGFVGGLAEYDSNSGASASVLLEGGGKKLSAGVASNRHSAQPLLFIPVAGAAGLVLFDSGVGFYAGTPNIGWGAYLNVTSRANCNYIRGR